ncbi:hypothetical protein, partial [Lysinibacillus xylanilyticus]|uniref:hypothetical protein n=1 Tax=Lysinibacillus xylanilyticus TaxID=582475 RepID=UPI0036DA06A8
MDKYRYGNYESDSRTDLCKQLGISITSVGKREKLGFTFYESVEYVLSAKKQRQNTLDKARQLFSVDFNSYGEIDKHLRNIGFKKSNVLSAPEIKLLAYEKLVNTEHEFLVIGNKPFVYDNIQFKNLALFGIHYKIIIGNLYRELIENGFAVKDAVTKCSNDPEYREKLKPVIKGKSYSSVNELVDEHGLTAVCYKRHLREGCTYEEALEKLITNSGRIGRFDSEFPVEVGTKLCKDLDEVAKALGIARVTLVSYLKDYQSLEEFVRDREFKDSFYGRFKT